MNKDSNAYTFGFAIAMVVVVGSVLSIAAMSLKKPQQENQKQEKMKNILTTVGVMNESSDMKEAGGLFETHVKEQLVLDSKGNIKEGVVAFDVDVRKEYRELKAKARDSADVNYPIYRVENEGNTYYVIPMVGTGLWGPIWGFVALKDDLNTVYGASFDHKTETPGLGAEINQNSFEDQFKGDAIYDEAGAFVSIAVLKGAAGGSSDPHGVDGITGGTITSKGVDEMIRRTLSVYDPYFKTLKQAS
ncbi:MAG: NADH:ubiquinone reductase (Na(+)-transporting) subunit C [Leptolyngbya sp. SIO3F4]|nr:NADH:ubiquinone reductase (Na(+)-transporting) subunit C [Leptolyngbya sp. SIO3F4]